MKKKFMMLSCIAAVAIATVVGKKTFESHAYETSNLLMQNVEALATGADDGDDYDESPCNGGFPQYATVAVLSGKHQVTTHYCDGVNGKNGIDETYNQGFNECVAEGSGKIRGGNFRWSNGINSSRELVECKGPQGHSAPI